MKKLIIFLAFCGIVVLTLNSCARTNCKGGSCPVWSDIQNPTEEFDQFRFLEIVNTSTDKKDKV